MITTTEIRVQANPTAPQSVYPFAIRYFEESDINVEIVDSLGATTVLTLTTDFSLVPVNGDPANGCTVTTVADYTTGDTVTIYREVPETQLADFVRGGDLPPEVLNASLDRGVAISQQIDSANTRSLICPITDPTNTDYDIPTVALRANKVLGFDGNGNVVMVTV
jgi:hypothetical protein